MAKQSNLGSLSLSDFWKTLLMLVIGSIVSGAIDYGNAYLVAVQNHTPMAGFSWAAVLVGALVAGGSYVLKQLGTNSDGKFLKKDTEVKL